MRTSVLGLALLLALAHSAGAAPSTRTLHIQGVLRDAAGQLQSMAVGLVVKVYAGDSGGSALYEKSFTTVAVDNGFFSVELDDPQVSFAALDDAWIGVQVAGDQAELPRQHLGAVPFAFSAINAAQLGGADASRYQRVLMPADCGPGKFIQAIAPDGTVTCASATCGWFSPAHSHNCDPECQNFSQLALAAGWSRCLPRPSVGTVGGAGARGFFLDAACSANPVSEGYIYYETRFSQLDANTNTGQFGGALYLNWTGCNDIIPTFWCCK